MSRAGYADFFPAAPSVLAEKKAQAERERIRQRSHREYDRDTSNGTLSTTSMSTTGSTATNSSTVTSTQTVTKSALPSHFLHGNNRSSTISNSSPPILSSLPAGTRHSLPPRPQVSLAQPYTSKDPPPLPPPPPAPPTPKATPPAVKQDPAKRNWRLKYDPVLEKKGVPKKSKDTIVRFDGEGVSTPITDPRLAIPDYTKGPKVGKKRLRSLGLYRTRWKWDENYIGPGPPSQILISGLSPLTTENEISMHFRLYGDIQKICVKVDPATGGSLGICSILYRDNVRTKCPAHEGAKKAVVGGNGTTIGMQKVRVELDRDGLKSKKMAGRIVEDKRRKEQEAAKNRPKPAPRDDHLRSSHRGESPTRGRGISPARKEGRIPGRERERERDRDSRVPETQKENYRALDHVGRWPYIFITARCIPGDQRYVRHLEGRLKNFGLKTVLCDRTGFYVVFWEKRDMEKCFRVCDGDRLFSYKMLMKMHPGGTRTPSPDRSAPKIVETKPVDFLSEASTALMKEMKIALMTDLKKRIVAPIIYDSLESGRLHKKRKIEEAESRVSAATNEVISPDNTSPAVKDERATSILSLNPIAKATAKSIATKPVKVALPRFKKRVVPKKEEPPKINGIKKRPAKTDARPLAHRLNQYDSEGGSDDESTATGDRPVSRGLSTDIGDDESISHSPLVDHIGNLKRKRGSVGPTSKLRDTAVSTDDEEPVAEEGRTDFKEETTSKKPRLSDNERSPLISESLEDEVESAPSKAAKSKENKKRKCDIDFTSSESDEDNSIVAEPVERTKKKRQGSPPSRRPPVDDEDEIVNVADDYDDINDSIAIKSALKTGKELSGSRAKVKAEVVQAEVPKTLLLSRQLAVGGADEDVPKEVVDVSWGVSTAEGPIPAVEDDEDMVLDLDGWQTLVKDEEDFKFLKIALAQNKVEPADLGNVAAWAFKQKEMKAANREGTRGATRIQEKIEGFYRPNITGCARTEGYRKIPEKEKSMYLPHRLQVAAKRAAMNQPPSPSAPTTTTKPAGSTSRSNRVNNRRLVANLQNQKQIFSSDVDVMRFNQLKKRKKPVRFARSAIHNWGLYAMENIAANDMIIEYVGEIVRQQVADMREVKYLKSGIGSSYLFRIDENTVIDATKRGGIARFINHSCTPNCTAKIIKVEGSKRIVIYALRDIKENEELTYDYKFERELGSDDRIPCLCGSSGCKGFLN